jgi:hypothetical protein
LSVVTSHVGFGLTYSSTYLHPFFVARLLNSLDRLGNLEGPLRLHAAALDPARPD